MEISVSGGKMEIAYKEIEICGMAWKDLRCFVWWTDPIYRGLFFISSEMSHPKIKKK